MKILQIDIIMPCYYHDDIVEHAIKNIVKQKTQHQLRLIMINDCSPNTKDNYHTLVEKYKNLLNITLIKPEHNSGPGFCRQMGIQQAQGDFILFHDDDDVAVFFLLNGLQCILDEVVEHLRYLLFVSSSSS